MKEFESKFGLIQLINKPTRCRAKTANILDLIFTNSKHIKESGSWETNFSDHEPVYVIQKKPRLQTQKTDFQCRCFSNYNKDLFQNELRAYDWDGFFDNQSPEEAWQVLSKAILEIANVHCPIRNYTSKKILPPWLNNEILLVYEKQRSLL